MTGWRCSASFGWALALQKEGDYEAAIERYELTLELEEIRAALGRCAHGDDREPGLRLAGATWRIWQASGQLAEAVVLPGKARRSMASHNS